MRSLKIKALLYEVPKNGFSHEEFKRQHGHDHFDCLAEATGIYNCRVCSLGKITSNLVFLCGERTCFLGEFGRESVDLLIVANQIRDYLLPTTACIPQGQLGLSKDCAAFDINPGCPQFFYIHGIAQSMSAAGLANRAIVVNFDSPSIIIDRDNLNAGPLFEDGAATAIPEATISNAGYCDFLFGKDGSKHKAVYGKSGVLTVGISLWHRIKAGVVEAVSSIVLSGFGLGLSWPNNLYRLDDGLPTRI